MIIVAPFQLATLNLVWFNLYIKLLNLYFLFVRWQMKMLQKMHMYLLLCIELCMDTQKPQSFSFALLFFFLFDMYMSI